MTLFDPGPPTSSELKLSAGRARTLRQQEMLERGRHPATNRALLELPGPATVTCETCTHHLGLRYHGKLYHKCAQHTLGFSHSEASDIRVGWPACTLYAAESEA